MANKLYEHEAWTLPTLLNIVRSDKMSEQRHLALAAIGAIGAIDPYHKMIGVIFLICSVDVADCRIYQEATLTVGSNEITEDEDEVDLAHQANRAQRAKAMALLDEHYLNVVFDQLVAVLSDETLAIAVRTPAVEALQTIYRSFRLKARSFNKIVCSTASVAGGL